MKSMSLIIFLFTIALSLEVSASNVHKAVWTANSNVCNPNDELVEKYKNNFVRLGGYAKDKKAYAAAGFLIDGCKKILTASHVIYEVDLSEKLNPIGYAQAPFSNYANITRSEIKEGPWRTSGLYKDEVTTLQFTGAAVEGCQIVPIYKSKSHRELIDAAKAGREFVILKLDEVTGSLCVQKCNITTNGSVSRPGNVGSIEHDCRTVKGNSGSAVFVKEADGEYLVGVHTGGNENTSVNTFSPVSWDILSSLRAY